MQFFVKFNNNINYRNIKFDVLEYSHHRFGGPNSMKMTALADIRSELDTFYRMLGMSIELYDFQNILIWEGYIDSLRFPISNNVSHEIKLDNVANKIAVIYNQVIPGESGSTKTITSWEEDSISQERYGIIERIDSKGNITSIEAIQYAKNILRDNKNPITKKIFSLSDFAKSYELNIEINCSGHWKKLSRNYYANADGFSVDTITQLQTILLTSSYVSNVRTTIPTSGIEGISDKQSTTTILHDVEELLSLDTNVEKQILLTKFINHDTILIDYNEISPTTKIQRSDGKITTFSNALLSDHFPIIEWLQLKELVGVLDNDETYVFVKECSYNVETQKRTLKLLGD